MKRRTFLVSAAAVLAGFVGWRAGAGSPQAAVIKVLQKRLPYLKLDPAGVQRFAQDLVARQAVSGLKLRLLDSVGALYTSLSMTPGSRLDRAVRHHEDRIVTQYLISSDFFTHGADKSRTVNYFGYYDPLVACNNPFARPVVVTPASEVRG